MRKFQVFCVTVAALFALAALVAPAALAQPTFLLAEWLLAGSAITTPNLVEMEGELTLINAENPIGMEVQILCSGILTGTVGGSSAGLVTELLNLPKEAISMTALLGLELVCANTKNCENPKVWAEELPWETELELMEGVVGSPFFVDLILQWKIYSECTIVGTKVNELCTFPELAAEAIDEVGGSVLLKFSDAFQVLAGLKLGECPHVETGEVTGSVLVLPTAGMLTVSSGA